ncbi:altered inheritance rate of mitochondria protein 25 [Selaginella moellendorffii]|uniref:altered inheritance rate of mitochondria protein 25 n=1 Tax=Selaginella moellendorffii TaxID=88036 RepID=UPI000D1CE6B4|nr:altered inheritance rate of mitochondria protein 25 [Selaginella moellendorffii]|eukprot:XP_024541935.1 altered inheritance rate of mitochondria protein 25 [Selaginella moellendorffii]
MAGRLLRAARRIQVRAPDDQLAHFARWSSNPAGAREISLSPACNQSVGDDQSLSRRRLIERMLFDKRRRDEERKLRLKLSKPVASSGVYNAEQPPPSEPLVGALAPDSPQEHRLVPVLARPDLMVTRNIEWANVAFGLEQQNRYVIMDPRQPQAAVGYLLEESSFIMRQLLRTRRPFIANVLDAYGNQVFQVRRPAWLINSTIFVEVDGILVGEVHRRWHVWRRIYDLYLGKTQFGRVENPGFWNWTFTVCDENGDTLAVVDRNWRGFGYEFFTDAGQYVVRFGEVLADGTNRAGVAGQYVLQGGEQAQNVDPQVEPLSVSRSLTLTERAIVLALAVSLDNDYFSRHSGMGMPIPIIGGSPEP